MTSKFTKNVLKIIGIITMLLVIFSITIYFLPTEGWVKTVKESIPQKYKKNPMEYLNKLKYFQSNNLTNYF